MTLLYLQIKLNEETMTIQISQTFIPCKLRLAENVHLTMFTMFTMFISQTFIPCKVRLAWYRVHKYEYKYKYTNT